MGIARRRSGAARPSVEGGLRPAPESPRAPAACFRWRFESEAARELRNPRVLVEVLSSETERDDRGEKFAHYRRLDSLEEYVLVSQHERRIEVFRRTPEGWILTEALAGERIALASIEVVLDVDVIYFDPTAA